MRNILDSILEMSTKILDQFLSPSMELFWVGLWLCIWSFWWNVQIIYTLLWLIKHVIYILNGILMILWSVDLIILVIPRITNQFRWVELTCFVDYLMDCIWVERYIHMQLSDPWYDFHELQYSYISLYLEFGKFNWKLGTLQWNWQIVFGFESLFLVKDECTDILFVIGYLLVLYNAIF